MCGISGTFAYAGSPAPDPELLERMVHAMAHRGPDDHEVFTDGPLGFGHRRLSIIDVAGGNQPIANEDGTVWIIYNGEIYNYRELRPELERLGHQFTTQSDTEVIVHLYEELGDACLERLNGIFTVAIWDSRRQRLLLARDPFGVKPLYYAESGRGLSFASEIKVLIADPQLSREVDPTALDWFLTYRFVPSPRTMLRPVRKLPPGHLLVADRSGASVRRYTTVGVEPTLRIGEAEATELLTDAFEQAVHRQMVSDVPVGAFLSGGVDSAAIVAMMARHSDRVRTYTVGFAEGGEYNELVEARETARLFGTDHHELLVSAEQLAEILPKVIWHLDEPISTSSAVPLYLISDLAHQDVKVALAGQGADEPFAGYTRYLGERYRGLWAELPGPVRRLAARAVEALPRTERLKRGVRALATNDHAERFHQIYAVFPDGLKGRLLRPEVRRAVEESSRGPIRAWLAGLDRISPLARMQYADMRLSLADDLLLYGDKMTMAHSIEMRVPFLDLELMRLVERIPPELKLKGRTGKYIWKRAASRFLPRQVVERPKKGFATPIDQWFRGELSAFVRDTLLGEGAAVRQYLDEAVVRQLVADHQRGRHDYRRQLFSLVAFELWHQQFVAGAGLSAVATSAHPPAVLTGPLGS